MAGDRVTDPYIDLGDNLPNRRNRVFWMSLKALVIGRKFFPSSDDAKIMGQCGDKLALPDSAYMKKNSEADKMQYKTAPH